MIYPHGRVGVINVAANMGYPALGGCAVCKVVAVSNPNSANLAVLNEFSDLAAVAVDFSIAGFPIRHILTDYPFISPA